MLNTYKDVEEKFNKRLRTYKKIVKILHDEKITFSEYAPLIDLVNDHIKTLKEHVEYPDYSHWSTKIKVCEAGEVLISDVDDIIFDE